MNSTTDNSNSGEGGKNRNDDFARAMRSDLPKADAGMDTGKRFKLLGLAGVGLILVFALFLYVTRKSDAAVPTPSPLSKADRVIKDVQDYRAQENDPSKHDSLVFGEPGLVRSGNPQKDSPLSTAMNELLANKADESNSDAIDPEAPIRSNSSTRQKGRQAQESYDDRPRSSQSQPVPHVNAEYIPSRDMQKRLSKAYADVISFNDNPQILNRPASVDLAMAPNPAAGLDSQYRHISDKVPVSSGFGRRYIAAGTELRGYTNESLNTDYPSIIKGTLTSPPEVRGATVLISYRLTEERAMANIEKIILPSSSPLKPPSEVAIQSVVKDGLPGLGGDVDHHWIPQIAASVASASMTAGALYYAAKSGNNNDLGTAVLLQPAIEKGIEGATKPLNYLGRERNITVTVGAGKEFTVLVTQGFEIP